MATSYTAADWARMAQAAIENEALRRIRDEIRAQATVEALLDAETEEASKLRRNGRATLRVLAQMEESLKALAEGG